MPLRALPLTKARTALLLMALALGTACSDSATAPQQVSIDRVAAARVMPSVTDARVRLAPAIVNVAVQARVLHDLQELENALANGDGQKARFHVGVVNSVLTEYRQQGTGADAADVSAIGLMLTAVSPVVGASVGVAF